VNKSFVPAKPFRDLRDLTRYRRSLVEAQSSERRRLIKLLEAADIKLAGVMSDVFGVSGRAILRALISGGHSPAEMAKLARGKLRKKRPLLIEALSVDLDGHRRGLLAMQLARVEAAEADIAVLDQQIATLLAPYKDYVELLTTVPGIDWLTAVIIIAEVGVDLSAFPTDRHFAAWIGVAPGNNESAGRAKPIGARKGNPYLTTALCNAATSAAATMPLAASFDTAGWLARTFDVYERVAPVVLGEDAAGPPLKRLIRVGDAFGLLFGEAEASALAGGVAATERKLGPAETVTITPEGLAEWQQLYRILQGYEAWAAHGPWITSRNAELGPQTATRFEVSRRVTAAEADAATRKRGEVRERVRELVGDNGVLMLPTMPGIALLVDAPEAEFEAFRSRAISMLCIAGLSGLPQVSVPVGMVSGCPLGLSLIGPPGRDRALLALARGVLAA
jgi:hypothetical protein